ncbi:hypothetical protein NLG97_g2530 [Lecanicillium saksenae]|uniref:Uncharacterized protein n=1 Tax=Lecanicillium saksenae TaxID=468837 RepID=A0ACC1R3B6_9HYPO|nr:hypothetical protein NLG97_g2530 [Lecanicillium saksenae]
MSPDQEADGRPPEWSPDRTMLSRVQFALGQAMSRSVAGRRTDLSRSCGWGSPADVRRKFAQYTGQMLEALRADITEAPEKFHEKAVILRLSSYTAVELTLSSPALRHHFSGLLAAVAAIGGLEKAVETKQLSPIRVTLFLITIVITNTTSPSHDQMAAESYFTNRDIDSYYGWILFTGMPCPTNLFISIRDINQLRRKVASSELGCAEVRSAAREILASVTEFDPDSWTERCELPPGDLARWVASMYQSATRLYCLMSLAVPAGLPFSTQHRIATAKALLGIIIQVVNRAGYVLATTWPLMVAGASLGGTPRSEHAGVDRLLGRVREADCASDGVFLGHECLRRFWASGKTGWDDCFTTWYATVP